MSEHEDENTEGFAAASSMSEPPRPFQTPPTRATATAPPIGQSGHLQQSVWPFPPTIHQVYGYPPPPTPNHRPLHPPSPALSTPPSESSNTRTRKPKQQPSEKLDVVLNAIKDVDWTLGDFLHHLFRRKGPRETRSLTYTQMVSKFLCGNTKIKLADVLDAILHNPWGIPKAENEDRTRMFSTEVSFRDMAVARPTLTAFAAQIVEEEMVKEVKRAARKESGLHATKAAARDLIEGDLDGLSAFDKAESVFRKFAPLSFRVLLSMASPHQRNRRSRAKNADKEMRAPPANHRPPKL
ncbi:hypothetical protein V5O48_015322, partial [Marasmius crinis-equi]